MDFGGNFVPKKNNEEFGAVLTELSSWLLSTLSSWPQSICFSSCCLNRATAFSLVLYS
jgi:hypothetical protein